MMNKVDLSCLVGSQVLCEFWRRQNYKNAERGFLDLLITLSEFCYKTDSELNRYGWDRNDQMYQSDVGVIYDQCRIYSHDDYWISNADGKLVLPDGLAGVAKTVAGGFKGGNFKDGMFIDGFTGASTPLKYSHPLNIKNTSKFLETIIAVKIIAPSQGWEW